MKPSTDALALAGTSTVAGGGGGVVVAAAAAGGEQRGGARARASKVLRCHGRLLLTARRAAACRGTGTPAAAARRLDLRPGLVDPVVQRRTPRRRAARRAGLHAAPSLSASASPLATHSPPITATSEMSTTSSFGRRPFG